MYRKTLTETPDASRDLLIPKPYLNGEVNIAAAAFDSRVRPRVS